MYVLNILHSIFIPFLFLPATYALKGAISSIMDLKDISPRAKAAISSIEDIISQDEGGRGMASLVVKGDLESAAKVLVRLNDGCKDTPKIVILSGFPCCVDKNPPTETDGPPGTLAIARAAVCLGYDVTIVTDDCNREVFCAAASEMDWADNKVKVETFPAEADMNDEDYTRMNDLADKRCDLVIACERAGPSKDNNCYTMRGINMTSRGLIAPVHNIVDRVRNRNVLFVAIGDGGNELGMGKVYEAIINNPSILNGELIAAAMPADYLIAASVSNWGGYALAAACACVKLDDTKGEINSLTFIPTSSDEVSLLDRCVKVGCRDGVSGEMESTVDGMPLKTSLSCLESIRKTLQEFSNSLSVKED